MGWSRYVSRALVVLLEGGRGGAVLYRAQELLVFNYQDRFVFKVVVVLRRLVNDSFDNVGEGVESFEEHVHQLVTPDRVLRLVGQHFEVADILIDVWEVEGEAVEAGLRHLLFRGVSELGLESR